MINAAAVGVHEEARLNFLTLFFAGGVRPRGNAELRRSFVVRCALSFPRRAALLVGLIRFRYAPKAIE